MDNFERKIRDSKNVIRPKELDSDKIYSKASTYRKFSIKDLFTPRLVVKYLLMILVIGIAFGSGLLINNHNSHENPINHGNEPQIIDDSGKNQTITPIERLDLNETAVSSEYLKFTNEEDLIQYLKSSKSSYSYRDGAKGVISDETVNVEGTAAEPTNSDVVESDYQTNVQVEGVDEADIVKVIKNKIFYLPTCSESYRIHMLEEVDDKLFLRKTIKYGKSEEVIKTVNGFNLIQASERCPLDLYVTDNYLIVRVSKYEYKYTQSTTSTFRYYSYYDYTHTTLFEIYDIETLDLVTRIDTAGDNISTRLVNDTLYVVNNYYDYMNNTKSFYYFPFFYIDDIYYETGVDRIYYPKEDDYKSKSYISVYKIDLGEQIKVEDLHILSSNANNLYATAKNLYLINSYGNEVINDVDYQYISPISVVTVVNISDGLTLSGSFKVKGYISDKYWIDEKDNYVRVVSNGTEVKNGYIDQKYFYSYESYVFNYLTIFEKTEEGYIQISQLTKGIGKEGESIKSARFNGDRVTVVTFRQTDPLYYIDIADPYNPVITSAFEISGFSVYQHPYKDNLVIGFGYEANDNGSITGYKITLFDISDKENIKAVGESFVIASRENIGKYTNRYYYEPEILSNPKALFVNLDRDIFGFRIQSTTYSSSNYETRFTSEYIVFKVEVDSPKPLNVIVHEKYDTADWKERMSMYDRMVFIGKNYYLLCRDVVYSYIYEDGKLIDNAKIDLYKMN